MDQLQTLITNSEKVKEYINMSMEYLIESAVDLVHSQSAGSTQLVKQLESALIELIRKEDDINAEISALNALKDQMPDNLETWTDFMRESKDKFLKLSQPKNHRQMKEFKRKILEVSNAGDAKEDDVELKVERTRISDRCPLTQMPFKEPYTSTLCKHSFEKMAILNYLGQGERSCPTSGCTAKLKAEHMRPNKNLLRYIQRMAFEEATQTS